MACQPQQICHNAAKRNSTHYLQVLTFPIWFIIPYHIITISALYFSIFQVPCAVAIRSARAVAEEVPAASHTSLGSLAALSERNSERDTHRLVKKYNIALPIKMSDVTVADETISFLKMSSWAEFIMEKNLWHHLAGLKEPDHDRCGSIWSSFWEKYRKICPGHRVFEKPSEDLARTCALLLHGDEGRSAKKSPILVVASHSILGHGLRTARCAKEDAKYDGMKLNYMRSTWTTRFLLGVLPRRMYADDDGESVDAFQDFLKGITLDLNSLFEDGVTDRCGRRFFFAVISVMGDWPWIQKAGCLSRSFFNAAKKASSKAPPKGVCHLCCADMVGYPWEDWTSKTPAWVATINTLSPFARRPSLLGLPLDDSNPSSLFTYDLFHTWHLGCGKTFMASAIVVFATSRHFAGSMVDRISAVSGLFERWCKTNKVQPYLKKITQAKLSWLSNSDFPQGAWSKGSTTTYLMKWFVEECEARVDSIAGDDDRLLLVTFEAARASNLFLKELYRQEVWIHSSVAARIASLGLLFLKKHGEAVRMAFQKGRNLFMQMPNLHRWHHISLQLKWDSEKTNYVLSPLAVSSQTDEDFIGRPSRISRRVHARTVVLRTLQRSLVKAWAQYVRDGLLILDRR